MLNLAQPETSQVPVDLAVGAILVATSSNNLAKTVYALVYSNGQLRASAAALALLSACGIALAVLD